MDEQLMSWATARPEVSVSIHATFIFWLLLPVLIMMTYTAKHLLNQLDALFIFPCCMLLKAIS